MLTPVRYLDHNATSPMSTAARLAWLEALDRWPGNPSSPHRIGSRASRVLDEAREELGRILGCRPADLTWTGGATESNNAVLHHCAQVSGGEAWISAIEHPSVQAAARRWFPGRVRAIPSGGDGVVEVGWIADALRNGRPAVVAVMAANNETGVLQPWRETVALCREAGVPYLCDASQWLGKLPAAGLGACDYLTGCGHKFGGAPGVGFVRAPSGFRPLLVGGPQEDGRRAGTENVPGIHATAAALKDRESALVARGPAGRAADRDAFERRLAATVEGVERIGRGVPRLWNTSAVLLPAGDCRRRWVVRLDRLGFAVSTGSACSSGREKASPVLAAMGLEAAGERMIRVSGGWETPAGDWEALAEAILGIAAEGGGGGGEVGGME